MLKKVHEIDPQALIMYKRLLHPRRLAEIPKIVMGTFSTIYFRQANKNILLFIISNAVKNGQFRT